MRQRVAFVAYSWALFLSGFWTGTQDNPKMFIAAGISLLIGNVIMWRRLGKHPIQ